MALVRERNGEQHAEALVDLPVALGPAAQWPLTILVSSAPAAFERVRPLLEILGQKISFLGEEGRATKSKLINKYSVLGSLMCTLAEAVALGELIGNLTGRNGIPIPAAGAGGSRVLDGRRVKLEQASFSGDFTIELMYKDLHYAQDLAWTLKRPLLTGSIAKYCCSAMHAGFGNDYIAGVYQAVRGHRRGRGGISENHGEVHMGALSTSMTIAALLAATAPSSVCRASVRAVARQGRWVAFDAGARRPRRRRGQRRVQTAPPGRLDHPDQVDGGDRFEHGGMLGLRDHVNERFDFPVCYAYPYCPSPFSPAGGKARVNETAPNRPPAIGFARVVQSLRADTAQGARPVREPPGPMPAAGVAPNRAPATCGCGLESHHDEEHAREHDQQRPVDLAIGLSPSPAGSAASHRRAPLRYSGRCEFRVNAARPRSSRSRRTKPRR